MRRPWWTRPAALLYLSQVSARGAEDNALDALAELHRERNPATPLTTALLTVPEPARAREQTPTPL